MSRIGKKPIRLPEKVNLSINNGNVVVEGPKGRLSNKIPEGISITLDDNNALVARSSDDKQVRALHGLTRILLANMIKGTSEGFEKGLRISGLGYKAQFENGTLTLQLNHSHPILYKVPEGIDISIDRPETVQNQPEIPLTVKGIDKQLVGHVAAVIRDFQRPEPYRGKGIKYRNERIKRKAGKAAG